MNMKHLTRRVIIAVTNTSKLGNTLRRTGWYLPDVANAYFVFKKHGFSVNFVSPKGGLAPVDEQTAHKYSIKDNLCSIFLHNHMDKLQNTQKVIDLNPKDYDAIFFAGGHGSLFDISYDEDLAKFSAEIYDRKGVVGGVSHGPVGLVNIKMPRTREYLIRNKVLTGFSNEEEDDIEVLRALPFLLENKLRERESIYMSGYPWRPHVKVCERIVTGQNPESAKSTAETIVDVLKYTVLKDINIEIHKSPNHDFNWVTQ